MLVEVYGSIILELHHLHLAPPLTLELPPGVSMGLKRSFGRRHVMLKCLCRFWELLQELGTNPALGTSHEIQEKGDKRMSWTLESDSAIHGESTCLTHDDVLWTIANTNFLLRLHLLVLLHPLLLLLVLELLELIAVVVDDVVVVDEPGNINFGGKTRLKRLWS